LKRKASSAVRFSRHPKSITPHKKAKAEIYVLSKEEGGRHTPFFNGYRPQFYFRTTDVTGHRQPPKGVEMIMPGDNIAVEIDLIVADRDGEDPALRHPRRWPHHRCRSYHRDHRIIFVPQTFNPTRRGLEFPGPRLRRLKKPFITQARSSIGRVAVSKTVGWGFDSLRACQHF
jgi:hypothetical protein